MPSEAPSWTVRVVGPQQETPAPPLVVLLHGIGADEFDLLPLAQSLDPRCKVASIRAPHAYYGGCAWFHIDFQRDGSVVPDVPQARAVLADLVRWVEAAPTRFGTDPQRTFLLGFSQGAMMSLGVLGTVPERLAGVIALSGRTPGDLFPPTAPTEAIARVPLLVAHGTLDEVLPVTHGRATRDAFAPISRDFTYQEFQVAHGIIDTELALVADWLAQRL
ncbi:MAG TPA: phospholipase [Candidatus Binatia bacterium]|jgi:phospholipase/carboxylesterase|nr:phospholipase [Candidatus Binatia bacterium]